MILVVFAVPQESREFRRAMRAADGRLGGEEIRVAHLGVGAASAALRLPPLLVDRPRLVICAGFAGALDPRLQAGDVVLAENFSAPELLGRAATGNRVFVGPLITRPEPVESVAAKAVLASASGALAVDMETSAVAEACRAAGVPLLAVRAISDDSSTPLPVPFAEWFDAAEQKPRPWRLVKYLVFHPASIAPFIAFLRIVRSARTTMSEFLLRFFDDRK